MSTPSAPRKAILGLGIKQGTTPNTTEWTAEKVRAAMEAQTQAARDAGFDMTMHLVDPDPDRAVMEANVAGVTAVLAERDFDGVVVGFGLRGQPELTWMFQKVVNAVVEVSLAKSRKVPRMVFSLAPTEVLKSLQEEFNE